jgi:hypothetical protein
MSVPKGTYRRHGAATEKVFGHPSIVLLKVIRSVLVAEYVNEHFTAGLQPSGKLGKEGGVSFHMFKHFNGKDVRESVPRNVILACVSPTHSTRILIIGRKSDSLLLFFEIKLGEIASDDLDVAESLFLAHVVNVDLLRSRIGQHLD